MKYIRLYPRAKARKFTLSQLIRNESFRDALVELRLRLTDDPILAEAFEKYDV
jgi:hypothetical protein